MAKNKIKKVENTKKTGQLSSVAHIRKSDSNIQYPSTSTFDILESHFQKYQSLYISLIVALSLIFSFLSFDNKISTANDDAMYIEAGSRYVKDFFGYFYTHNAPLYPIVLALLIKILGVKLFQLKVTSIIFFCLSIYLIYRGFRKRIPYIILFPSLFLTAINFQFLVYASLTYTETFSLMIFSFGFIYFFKVLEKLNHSDYTLKSNLLSFVLLGICCFVLMLTRNVALASIGVIVLFLAYRKKYIESLFPIVGFSLFFILYKLALKNIWHISGSQFSTQGSLIFHKDAYQPQLGNETAWGLVIRFWENCEIYISSRLYFILGFREETSPNNAILTLVSIGIVVWAIYLMHIRKQYTLLLSTLFYVMLLGITFVSLHTSWGQTRLIMLYLPFIFFSVFYIFYYYGLKYRPLQNVYLLFLFILLMPTLVSTFRQIQEKFPIFVENLTGDPTYGYTRDWQNYIRMTQWCAQELPNETQSIAVRKAPMSFIFSEGKEFYGIYSTPTENADSLLMPLRAANVKYMMLAELRLVEDRYIEGQFIGTLHRYAYFIQQKYPKAFDFVHQEGDYEKSQLFKINYQYIDSLSAVLKQNELND